MHFGGDDLCLSFLECEVIRGGLGKTRKGERYIVKKSDNLPPQGTWYVP